MIKHDNYMTPKKETIIWPPNAWNVRKTHFKNTAIDVRSIMVLPLCHIPWQRSGKERLNDQPGGRSKYFDNRYYPPHLLNYRNEEEEAVVFDLWCFTSPIHRLGLRSLPVLISSISTVKFSCTVRWISTELYIYILVSPAKFKRRTGIKEPSSDHNKAAGRFLDLLETYHRPRGGRPIPKSFSRITTIGEVWRDHPIESGGRKQTPNSFKKNWVIVVWIGMLRRRKPRYDQQKAREDKRKGTQYSVHVRPLELLSIR
jgi:hypothetical protein